MRDAVGGRVAGAHLGEAAWPREWSEKIEYRERIAALADALSR